MDEDYGFEAEQLLKVHLERLQLLLVGEHGQVGSGGLRWRGHGGV